MSSPPVTAFICDALAVCSALQSQDQPLELWWLGQDAQRWCCSSCVHGKAAGVKRAPVRCILLSGQACWVMCKTSSWGQTPVTIIPGKR